MRYGKMSRVLTSLKECPKLNPGNPKLNSGRRSHSGMNRNMLNFTQQFEVPFSKKQKTFSGFFIAFLKFALNLEHLGKKDEYPRWVISKIIDSERGGYLNV